MPSLETARRMNQIKWNGAKTIGQQLKEQSDFAMEDTWDNDIQSRVCYLYDYAHDDNPTINKEMTYEDTKKYKIDAKFIITKYSSISSDQVEYHLMFRPSQPIDFDEGDALFYYEQEYARKYLSEFPIGLYADIPDDKGIYRRWLVVAKEIGNQFVKYSVLPCNYKLCWIENRENKRIKRQMWGCLRNQASYTSGLWAGDRLVSLDNVNQIWLPMNDITERIHYLSDDNEDNQRLIISTLKPNPAVWVVSKVQDLNPLGILKLTYKQTVFDEHTDFIDWDTGDMYADYYFNDIEPIDELPIEVITANITALNNYIKLGGSYKLLTVSFVNEDGEDITDKYIEDITEANWKCFIGDEEYTENELITWLPQSTNDKIKIKIGKDLSLLTKILKVQCSVDDIVGEIELELRS